MRRIAYSAVFAMGCTIAVAAQSGMADKPQAKDPMAKDTAAKTVTVTGCVAESDGHFMLNGATMADMAGAPMTYDLSGGTLKPHVGHKVEVTGTMKAMAKGGMMGKEGAMAKEGTTMKKDDMKDMSHDKPMKDDMKKDHMSGGTLTVKSLKMISANCS